MTFIEATLLVLILISLAGLYHLHGCMHRLDVSFAKVSTELDHLIAENKSLIGELKQVKHIQDYLKNG